MVYSSDSVDDMISILKKHGYGYTEYSHKNGKCSINTDTLLKILEKQIKEEDVLKFYYCESRNKYYIGKRLDTMYYAEVMVYPDGKVCLSYQMSRYLPWGEHVVDENSAWKEHIYPSEPKEITFEEWLEGFLKQRDKCR